MSYDLQKDCFWNSDFIISKSIDLLVLVFSILLEFQKYWSIGQSILFLEVLNICIEILLKCIGQRSVHDNVRSYECHLCKKIEWRHSLLKVQAHPCEIVYSSIPNNRGLPNKQTFDKYIFKVFQYKYSILPKKVLIRQYFNTFEIQKVLKIPIPINQYFLR